MVLHDFLLKRLAPLQDRSHRPAWMYTRVNDIMQLDHGLGSSLGDTLLVVSLKALTTYQPSAELMMPLASYEHLCMNQAARTAMLTIMHMPRCVNQAARSSPGPVVWMAPPVVAAVAARQ
jgi:hypothetical protein